MPYLLKYLFLWGEQWGNNLMIHVRNENIGLQGHQLVWGRKSEPEF